MPLFEYECRSCGGRFEELVGTAAAEVRCPKCDSPDTGKLLSVFSAGSNAGSTAPSCYRPGCGSPGFT